MIVIVDYGCGNLKSIANALKAIGVNTTISNDPSEISRAEGLVLPGVGKFSEAKYRLDKFGITKALHEAIEAKTPILGICLGFQLLMASSSEGGITEGLGIEQMSVERIETNGKNLNVPHMGFNSVNNESCDSLFTGIPDGGDFYFVHSYCVLSGGKNKKSATGIATCNYGNKIIAAIESENVHGVQFHPEKSQTNGLQLLRNFCNKIK